MHRKTKSPLEELGECKGKLDDRLYEDIRGDLSRLDYEHHSEIFPARVYYNPLRGNFSKVRKFLGYIGAHRNRKWHQKEKYFRVDLDVRQILILARSSLVRKIKKAKKER